MSFTQALAVYFPHLITAPLLPLALLAITVLALSTHSAADTTVQERQLQRQKEETGESVALTKVHAIGFGFMASLGLLAMWMWSNVLGFTISLMLKVLKASSMSSPALLLLTAFIYDVFFVFVTPYLTSTGESIMEAAATGAALTVKETIPMLFRIPSFSPRGGEAMLGFGDVVLPGILVTFLRECDARLEEDQSSMLIGLDSTNAKATALLSSGSGKGVLLASRRHELSLLWNGWGGLDGEESDIDEDGNSEDESTEKGHVLHI
ncbi:Signal peptide peptidase-like 2A [Mortierella sp. AD032]|nr:Signal peptide peptidase-like 2A [Mortierella sp. AD032]